MSPLVARFICELIDGHVFIMVVKPVACSLAQEDDSKSRVGGEGYRCHATNHPVVLELKETRRHVAVEERVDDNIVFVEIIYRGTVAQ